MVLNVVKYGRRLSMVLNLVKCGCVWVLSVYGFEKANLPGALGGPLSDNVRSFQKNQPFEDYILPYFARSERQFLTFHRFDYYLRRKKRFFYTLIAICDKKQRFMPVGPRARPPRKK